MEDQNLPETRIFIPFMPADYQAPDIVIRDVLSEVTGLPDLENFPDLDLFDEGLLDSLSLVTLLIELSRRLEINLTPADVQREEWATPRLVVQSVKAHLAP